MFTYDDSVLVSDKRRGLLRSQRAIGNNARDGACRRKGSGLGCETRELRGQASVSDD